MKWLAPVLLSDAAVLADVHYPHTCSEHALYKVLGVTENHSVSLLSIALGSQRLNLDALAYWYWEVCGASFGIVEDCTE